MKKMNPVQMSYHFNEYLVRETAKFLEAKDICSMSMVSKLYSKHMKKLDYCFKEYSYRYFCSEYESYNIKLLIKQESQLSSSSIVFQNPKRITNERALPYNYTWKGLLTIGVVIKEAWKMFSHNKILQDELMIIREVLYSDLRECKSEPKLRRTNNYVENDFNSPLQIHLFDFLYEQQDLYEDYDAKAQNSILNVFNQKGGMKCNREDIPFAYLVNDFKLIKATIKTEDDKKKLQYGRWYYCIDTPEDDNSIEEKKTIHETMLYSKDEAKLPTQTQRETILLKSNIKRKGSEDIIEESTSKILSTSFVYNQLSTESNPVFYTLKCLYMSLMFYCQYTMRFLYTTYRNPFQPKKLLHEYLKRYKNYIETAKDLNDKLENLNVCVNYLYEEFYPMMPSFPKFSVLRLCMIIWNKELSSYVDQYDTMLSSIKLALTSVYSKQMRKEIKEIFNANCNAKERTTPLFNEICDGWMMISVSKSASRTTICSSLNKTILNVNKSIRKDTKTENVILEQVLASISDMFCNEYSVFYLNSINILTNNIYKEVESNFSDSIENQIRHVYKKQVLKNKLPTQKVIEEIINYFSSSFYSESILNTMRIRLYRTVRDVLINILSDSIIKNFNQYLDGNNLGLMKEFQAVDFFAKNNNPFRCSSIYKVLLNSLNESILPFIVREYLVMNFLTHLPSEQSKDLEPLEYIEKWFNEEEEKVLKADKQVIKELNRKQLPIEFDKHQRLLMSMSIKPTWNTIREVEQLELQSAQMEQGDSMMDLRLE